ncbi:uncharacterized protein HMPREF1541_03250 [Cyphellophora europaea CBS 101466]|uniref:Uncharacterized protein n=1 Tax=Cyphellophora europaea (strain CBS 101466) TaxID=1220924 RepID=W2RYA6_CYPE1|nr:uncharacterized protein HMPREF1541_03250 [Cyphellophora europaea CBS 101466]ETN41315.1 hypothetical protein HMPREF1541_03250 [Cyphellophora europaea CBS 101466]
MVRQLFRTILLAGALAGFATAQDSSTTTSPSTSGTGSTSTSPPASTSSSAFSEVPDVVLNVPELSVGRIELNVDNLEADINLHANVASLVSINAGVALSIREVNITIADVDAELELVVRLGHLVDIVNRVFESLDLNPLLIDTIGNLTNLLEPVIGAVDGLLGTVTQGGSTISFLVDNLGNIVQEVGGVHSIVGNYLQNMTQVGGDQTLSNGLIQRTFDYSPLNAVVEMLFNTAGQVVQAVVNRGGGGGGGGGGSSSTSISAAPTATASTTAGAAKRF